MPKGTGAGYECLDGRSDSEKEYLQIPKSFKYDLVDGILLEVTMADDEHAMTAKYMSNKV